MNNLQNRLSVPQDASAALRPRNNTNFIRTPPPSSPVPSCPGATRQSSEIARGASDVDPVNNGYDTDLLSCSGTAPFYSQDVPELPLFDSFSFQLSSFDAFFGNLGIEPIYTNHTVIEWTLLPGHYSCAGTEKEGDGGRERVKTGKTEREGGVEVEGEKGEREERK